MNTSMLVRLCVALVFVAAAFPIGSNKAEELPRLGPAQLPLFSMEAVVNDDARPTFVDQSAKFGEENGFAVRTGRPRSDGIHFVVDMWRSDVHILVLNPFSDGSLFYIYFYQTGQVTIPKSIAEDLGHRFKDFLGQISGVEFRPI